MLHLSQLLSCLIVKTGEVVWAWLDQVFLKISTLFQLSVLLARPNIGFTTTSHSFTKLPSFVGFYYIQHRKTTKKRRLRNSERLS